MFQRPDGFIRGRLDALTGAARATMAHEIQVDSPEDEAAAIRLITESCSPEDGACATELIGIVRGIQRTVGQGAETFGLMHGDLNQWNYFFQRGEVRVIDFDDCGYGYHLYDLAVTLSEVNYRSNTPALRSGLLAGYRSVRPLSTEHEYYLDAFIAFRDLQFIVWKLEVRNHPYHRATWANTVVLDSSSPHIESDPFRNSLLPRMAFTSAGVPPAAALCA
jgi:Ser/Thr protein kinase RdoA (MazF antagonist)